MALNGGRAAPASALVLLFLLTGLGLAAAPALAATPAARVELSSAEGAWSGVSCAAPEEGADVARLWVPADARVRVHADETPVLAYHFEGRGRETLVAQAPPGASEVCARFEFDPPRHRLARYVAPTDVGTLDVVVHPPRGMVPHLDGVPMGSDGPVWSQRLQGVEAGRALGLRVVDEGRVGEVPLLLTLGGVSLLALLGTLAWHAARPPLGGKVPERALEHLAELQARLLPVGLLFALLNVAFFTMGLRVAHAGGVPLLAPTFGTDASVAARAFEAFTESLVPPDVTLVALRPVDAVLALVQTALFLAFVTVLPLLLYELGAFVGPALESDERRAVYAIVPVLALLFLAGAFFGYRLMAPFMLEVLYGYASDLAAAPLLSLDTLVGFALLVSLAFGLAFELPVAMYALARLGVVRPATFLRYFRHAVLVIVVLSGVLTPDPSVVTQLLVAAPVTLLYLMGIGAAYWGANRRGARGTA